MKIYKFEEKMGACKDIVYYNWSIERAGRNWCIPRSTLYDFINKNLPYLDSQLYEEVKAIIKKHREVIKRGRSGKFIKND